MSKQMSNKNQENGINEKDKKKFKRFRFNNLH